MQNLPGVSVVVIGKNEEKNLEACFRSLIAMDYPIDKFEIIYVDTGSTDKSVDIAKRFSVKIAKENSTFPTPGLAFNRGIREAKYNIIHFVGGDMTTDKTYLKKAIGVLGTSNIVCVFGNVTERKSNKNFIAKVLSYPWRSRKVGYVDAPGGGGTFLKSILKEVGGYNPFILKGQETELGFRIRKKGYRIYMIDCIMAIHDYDINNLFDWAKRFYIIGKSFGKILTLPAKQSYSEFKTHATSLLIQGVVFLALVFFLLITKKFLFFLGIPIIIIAYVTIRYWKEYYYRRDWFILLYYLLMHFSKPIVLFGMLAYLWRHFFCNKLAPKLWKKGK